MKYNPEIHHRRSIRLQGYDYSKQGAYFITLCAYQRACLFGRIINNEMVLNQFGVITPKEVRHVEQRETSPYRQEIPRDARDDGLLSRCLP